MRYRFSQFIMQNVLLKSNLGPHIHLHRDYRQQDSRDPSHAAPYTYRHRWNDVRPHQGRNAPCAPTDQPRKKMTCPDRGAPPQPGTRQLSVSILRSARYQDGGQRRCRRHAIPAQKKSTGTQGTHRPQLGLNGMTTHGETRRQRGGHRKSSRTPVKPRPTDQTPGTEDSPPTGPDVSHLSESNPIPRRGEPSGQGPRSLKRDQTWWTPDKQRPQRSRRAPPTIVRE